MSSFEVSIDNARMQIHCRDEAPSGCGDWVTEDLATFVSILDLVWDPTHTTSYGSRSTAEWALGSLHSLSTNYVGYWNVGIPAIVMEDATYYRVEITFADGHAPASDSDFGAYVVQDLDTGVTNPSSDWLFSYSTSELVGNVLTSPVFGPGNATYESDVEGLGYRFIGFQMRPTQEISQIRFMRLCDPVWNTIDLSTVEFYPDSTAQFGVAGPTGTYTDGVISGTGDSGHSGVFYFPGLETSFDWASGLYNYEFEFTFAYNSSDGWNWAEVFRQKTNTQTDFDDSWYETVAEMNDGSDGTPSPAVRVTTATYSTDTSHGWGMCDDLGWNYIDFWCRRNCGISQIRWRAVPI